MTTLVNTYPYTHFFLGKIDDADVADIRAADASMATEAAGSVTIATHATVCQDMAYAIATFTDTEGGDSQDITSLASRAGQRARGRPTWEGPCTMRVYVSAPEVASDSVKIIREHAGTWVLFAEHETLGKLVAVVIFDAMSRPFSENGELVVSFTLQNAGRYLPKWVA